MKITTEAWSAGEKTGIEFAGVYTFGFTRYLLCVPELSRFYGIRITMYYDDHGEPHFHAEYAEQKAKFRIDPPGIIAGALPAKAVALVMEWLLLHQGELREAYARAERAEPLGKIAPLE